MRRSLRQAITDANNNPGQDTITFAVATNTIIDGGGVDRVLHVCPNGGCADAVPVTGVTIRNGSADFWGGILNQGATLNIRDSTIGGTGTGNYASDESGGGIARR